MTLKWYGDQAEQHVETESFKNIKRAARVLRNVIRKNVSTKGAAIRTRGAGGRFQKSKRRTSSPPGGYPYIQDGHLRRNINVEDNRTTLTSRVGTNVKYGLYLEMGTHKMKRRPWMSLGIKDAWGKMKAALGRGV